MRRRSPPHCYDVTTGPAGVVASACEVSTVMSMLAFVASSVEATLGSTLSVSSVISIPSASELYGHYHPYHQGMSEPPWESDAVRTAREVLRTMFASVVHRRLPCIRAAVPSTVLPLQVADTGSVDTRVIGKAFFSNALSNGVVVVELFGGMCSGLEMCLRNGVRVKRYVYCDSLEEMRAVAKHRCDMLSVEHAALFTLEAYKYAFTTLPHDVWQVSKQHVSQVLGERQTQVLLVAGCKCQGMSSAGS